jgi:hypothetical protein
MLHLTSNVSADRRPPGAVIVSSAAGGIQFEKQRRGVLVDLTSHHFDLEVFPPSVHTCTTVTRSEAHYLTVALATLLGGESESHKAADGLPQVTSSGGLLTSVKSAADDTQVQENRVSVMCS